MTHKIPTSDLNAPVSADLMQLLLRAKPRDVLAVRFEEATVTLTLDNPTHKLALFGAWQHPALAPITHDNPGSHLILPLVFALTGFDIPAPSLSLNSGAETSLGVVLSDALVAANQLLGGAAIHCREQDWADAASQTRSAFLPHFIQTLGMRFPDPAWATSNEALLALSTSPELPEIAFEHPLIRLGYDRLCAAPKHKNDALLNDLLEAQARIVWPHQNA